MSMVVVGHDVDEVQGAVQFKSAEKEDKLSMTVSSEKVPTIHFV